MRRLAVFLGVALSACTLLRDYEELRDGVDAGAAVPGTRDAGALPDTGVADAAEGDAAVADGAASPAVPDIGCGDEACSASTQVCCVAFVSSTIRTACAERTADASTACAAAIGPDRLAGVLECDTSAQCAEGSVCCGDGQARESNTKVHRASCVVGPSCGTSGNELCGPGRVGPGRLASCRGPAIRCVRTGDLDVSGEAQDDDDTFPLLKCSPD